MTGPPRWPRRRDWPRWLVASIDPERPAEITAPIPLGQCSVCAEDDRHRWSEVDAERIGAVVLRRLACDCGRCGRCDAQITEVHVDRR